MNNDKLIIGGHKFNSRFILGSGKYSMKLIVVHFYILLSLIIKFTC